MEMINVAELLKDCPKGMELDCINYNGIVSFEGISSNDAYPIKIKVIYNNECNIHTLTKYGQTLKNSYNKCVIFPKGKTTWEGFVPPCQFKDGDVVATTDGSWIGITEGGEKDLFIPTYCVIKSRGTFEAYLGGKEKWPFDRLATEEEKEKLFQVIKDNGYEWNAETKTLEKLIQPIFKAGNKVRNKNNHNIVFTITSLEENYYVTGAARAFWFDDQDDYELVPNKFDITTLKPFDSRVLVRDKNTNEWRAHFFSHYDNNSHIPYICIGTERINEYRQCIPFEGNEHLLGKTEDCIDFYKTWINEEN